MNTAVAIITTIIVTNWTYIGDFKDKDFNRYDVRRGQISTNTVAWIEYEGTNHQFILKSIPGPSVGEKMTLLTNIYITNVIWPTKDWSNAVIPNIERVY